MSIYSLSWAKIKELEKRWGEPFLNLYNKDTHAYVESGSGIMNSKKVYCEAYMLIHIEGPRG